MDDALAANEFLHDQAEATRGNAGRAEAGRGADAELHSDDRGRHESGQVSSDLVSSSRSFFISETFSSRQGEGLLTGTDSFFIRTSGCNLRCHFCDTPYASWNPHGQTECIDDLIEQARQSGHRHVVITGGEPMLPTAIVGLVSELRSNDFHVTIETAGTIDRPVHCDLMSISPKLASSAPAADQHARWHDLHQLRRMPVATMKRLMNRAERWQLKFVVSSPGDYSEILQVVGALGADADGVWIMPQGVTPQEMDKAKAWLQPWCDQHGFHFCDRMQIRWYGNRRGT